MTTRVYAEPSDIKAATAIADNADDKRIAAVIDAISDQIETYCGRVFYDIDTTATPRVFYTDSCHRGTVKVDDFHTTDGLVIATDENQDGTYEITWTTADYLLEPLNGVRDGMPGWPYDTIRSLDRRVFPAHIRRPALQVTARWGWATVPNPIHEACILQTIKLFGRKDSPLGVAGHAEFGVIRLHPKLDPDVERLLAPYQRMSE